MKDPGVSEVLGAVMMIAIIVTAFSILAVTFLSQPPPEKIPHASFKYYLSRGDDSLLSIYHAGGDEIDLKFIDNLVIKVNDREMSYTGSCDPDNPECGFCLNQSDNNELFNIGESLDLDVQELRSTCSMIDLDTPATVKIYYKTSQGNTEIWDARLPEVANFYVSDQRACVNAPVQFYDGSNFNLTSWAWNFNANEDSIIDSMEQNPVYTYTQPGFYSVTMSGIDEKGRSYTVNKKDYINVKYIHAAFSGSPRSGEEPLKVFFTDLSRCNPTSWSWDLGVPGANTSVQNPSYEYITEDGDHTSYYTISLTASEGSHQDTLTKENYIAVYPKCFAPEANFGYSGRRDVDDTLFIEFMDYSTSGPETINSWLWDFGDGKVSYEQHPTHEYPEANYTVTLTVGNDCGKYNTTKRKIVFPCTELTSDLHAEPDTGLSPLTVNFTDLSNPTDIITAWRWSFGDGTYYTSTNPDTRNPPPHTYDRVGTYYVSLMVQNECGQAFYKTPVIVVSQPGSIGGRLWDDRNYNRALDGGESGLSGWQVDLEERKSGAWQVVNTTTTDSSGYYLFNLEGVSNSVFRVKEHLPAGWRVTYSYGTYDQEISDSILIYSARDYSEVNFGNIGLHTSYIEIPGKFWMYGRPSYSDKWFNYSTLAVAAQYLDYNTTYNTNARTVPLTPITPPNKDPGRFITDPPGGYPLGYTNWGNSSFSLTFREYNNYLKTVGQGAYFMDNWKLKGVTVHTGNHFPVPDNTTITYDQLELLYKWDSTIHFDIDKPKEGEVIPYTEKYLVEAHFEGKGEQTTKCNLAITEPGSNPTLLYYDDRFFYNSTVGEYLLSDVDTRPFEGQKKLFVARMTLATTPVTYVYTYSNATIAYDPITATFTITSEATAPYVKGIATVTAQVSGKWQDNTSAVLYVDGKPVANMSLITPGLPSTIRGSFNVEPYAGQTVPIFVRVPYRIASVQDLMGPSVDSPAQTVTVLSKEPIHANFTADPWEGHAPHETAFTDLSTGGANSWQWDFNDGNYSTLQDPIHIFTEPGNYSVRLTIANASGASDYTEKNVTITGSWHNTNLLTSRSSYIGEGGVMSWISRGSNATITVNGSQYALKSGDLVEITLNSDHYQAKLFMAGSLTECIFSDSTVRVNGEEIARGNISSIRMPDLENFHSNLTLTAGKSYYAWINFQWDGFGVPISWKKNLLIHQLMPTPERFMSLDLDPTQTYFDGMASEYIFT